MRLSRCSLCLCALLAAARATALDPDPSLPAVTRQADTTTTSPPAPVTSAPAPPEPSSSTTVVPQDPSDAVAEPEPSPTSLTSSSLASPSTAAPPAAVEPSSYPPDTPTTPSSTLQPSPTAVPVESPSPRPPPASAPEPVPAPPPLVDVQPPAAPQVLEELPLTEAAPAPEFLSFNEWRERYVVQPDPSATRRGKKRPRHDAVAGAASGAERDEAPRAANESGAARPPLEVVDSVGAGGLGLDGSLPRGQGQLVFEDGALGLPPTTSSTLSPIQPLPNVGTGEPSDPLVHLKDRANYAGAECAAKLHRSSRQSKGASSILTEKKDRYMLTPCAATPKFVDVELCDEVQIDALVLANFEFFSSTFKHFKASCSVDYPGKPDDWHDLGTFRARNVRGVQVFRPLSNPPFCRYVRIDFLSHFGSEYYCPVSLLRVYGYTQLESFRESERKAKALEDALAAAELGEGEGEDDVGDEQERALEDALEVEVDKLERIEVPKVVGDLTASEVVESAGGSSTAPAVTPAPVEEDPHAPTPPPASSAPAASTAPESHDEPYTALPDASTTTGASLSTEAMHTSSAAPAPSTSASTDSSSAADPSSTALSTANATEVEPSASATVAVTEEDSTRSPPPTATVVTASSAAPADSSRAPSTSPTTSSSTPTSPSSVVAPPSAPAPHTATGRPAAGSDHPVASPRPPPSPSPSSPSRNDTHSSTASVPLHSASASHVPRAPLPIPPPPPPPPTVAQPQPGESIYGTIMKRLASLEHNQTLAMGFIEAQSGMLREAFGRVERRLSDVEGSRSRQEQSLRQSLLELEKQRVDLERERLALASQINLLAQEIRFEKHLTLAQLVGLLLVVIFVGFTRGIPTSPFLHLASSASTARASKRKIEALGATAAAREKDWEEQRVPDQEGDKAGGTSTDAPRRTHRISPSASLSRHSSAKRYPSISKPGALRRHYGPMTGSSSSSSKAMSRSWTPPVRHSSAPPEDVLDPTGSLVDPTRRRLVPRATGSGLGASRAYEFPLRSPSGSGTTSPARGASAQPPPALALALPSPSSHLTPQALESLRTSDLTPSSSNDADGEPGPPRAAAAAAAPAALGRSGLPFPLETIPSFDGYSTYSSEDEAAPPALHRRAAPLAPAVPSLSTVDRQDKGKGRAPIPSPSSSSAASTSSPGARPPKPHVPPRPATALGIRVPLKDDLGRSSGAERAQQEVDDEQLFSVQLPSSSLPSPPPEPVPLLRRPSGTQGGKDE